MNIDKPVEINISPEAKMAREEKERLEVIIREQKRQHHFKLAQEIKNERMRIE
jgi:hypothetical protein